MVGRRNPGLLAALCLVVFLLGLGWREFSTSHEARVAQTAREMAASGWPWRAARVQVDSVHVVKRAGVTRLAPDPDAPVISVNPWIVPILNGQVRLQKPPLPYWCAAVLFRLIGVSEAAARFVPALLGALTTFLLYDLARWLYGRRAAWFCALIWLTTYLVGEEYRLAMADPYLAFFTLMALWSWFCAAPADWKIAASPFIAATGTETRRENGARLFSIRREKGTQIFSVGHGDGARMGAETAAPFISPQGSGQWAILLFYIAIALGTLAKGPLILVHVGVPLALFHVCFRARPPRGMLAHLLGLGILVVIALPWPLTVLRLVPHATELWRYESIGEVSGENRENLRAWWFYFQILPELAWPWVPLGIWAIIYPLWRNRGRLFFPFAWYLCILLLFTFVGQKKAPYLLPAMPAQVLMLGLGAVPLLRLARRAQMRNWAGAIVAAQALIGLAWAIALLAWPVPGPRGTRIGLAVFVLLLAVLPIVAMLQNRPMRWFGQMALAYAAVIFVFVNYCRTPLENERGPKSLCRELEQLADGHHRVLLQSRLPEEVAFYLPLHPPQGIAPSDYLVVTDDQEGANSRARSHRPERPVDIEQFQGWIPDTKIVAVRRVPMSSAPGDARYKVYDLQVQRTALVQAE